MRIVVQVGKSKEKLINNKQGSFEWKKFESIPCDLVGLDEFVELRWGVY